MEIVFHGETCGGADRFTDETVLPTGIKELEHISGWPSSLERGTFNIQVDETKWPELDGLNFIADGQGVRNMDRNNNFLPVAYLPYTEIPDNTITPNVRDYGPHGGDLQFWPAKLEIDGVDNTINCYMFRRVGSNYRDKIEIISDIHIRTTHSLVHRIEVKLTVYDYAP